MALAKGPREGVCSARGCEQPAVWGIVWSNPKVHTGRTKTWLACDDHRDELASYMKYRGFPMEVVPVAELPGWPGATTAPGPAEPDAEGSDDPSQN